MSDALDVAFLGKRNAVLIFKCANKDCKNTVTIEGHQGVHDACAPQLSYECQKLFCRDCADGDCEIDYDKNW